MNTKAGTTSKIPKEELKVFKTLKDLKVVFDVGARDDISMFQVRPDIEYHLFEPVPYFCKQILEKIKQSGKGTRNVYVNQYGLADREGLFLYDASRQSFATGKKFELELLVNTMDWYSDHFQVQPDFVKIDTEGTDLSVIIGGEKTIKGARYIQFEYWDTPRKFLPYLKDFDLFLMNEPRLRSMMKRLSKDPRLDRTLIPLDVHLINFLEQAVIPTGSGGNILGIRK